jgi:hypothetical protein
MRRDRYESRDLLALVPHMKLSLEPELQELDRLLEDAVLVGGLKADWECRSPHTGTRGR